MEVAKEQSETKPKAAKYRPTPVELIASTVIGVASGLISAAASIRREFNEEVSNWPGAEELRKKYQTLFTDSDIKYGGMSEKKWHDHASNKSTLKGDHSKEFIQELLYKRYGIQTEGAIEKAGFWRNLKMSIYGTYQRHEHLGTSNKRLDVWYKAAAIATILGVGAYNLLTSIATRRKTREIEDLLIDRVLKIPENTVATIEAHEAKQQQARSHVTDVQHERRLKEPAHSAALET